MNKYKKWNESPSIADIILFELEIKDNEGNFCNPHRIEKVVIYYIERDFAKANQFYEQTHYNPKLLSQVEDIQDKNVKTEEDVQIWIGAKSKLEGTAIHNTVYYKEAKPVMITKSPIWCAENPEKSSVWHIVDDDKVTIKGKFGLIWHPEGMREGDYIIRWEWKVNEDSRIQTSQYSFYLMSDNVPKNSLGIRYTPSDKYEMLMDRYLPRVFKNKISTDDMTPFVLKNLNKSVAESLTQLEDLANQLIDILDANYTNSGVLPLLANMLDLNLRSNRETLWRRQIKQAVPLCKMKGTLIGLKTALESAGIDLLKLTRLWQVTSKYLWTDSFQVGSDKFEGDNSSFIGNLTKFPTNENFEISLRSEGSKNYTKLPKDVVLIMSPSEAGEKYSVFWNGTNLETPLEIIKGDIIKIKYSYNEMPESAKTYEDYIQSLPLADQRDEAKQSYPIKNWNVRLIEEDDPLFDVIIKERNPFYDHVVFGRIRTIFLYSEKVYNMDTYNGSLRESLLPCDIDKDFIDECSGGLSSKFNVYLDIEDLSDERIDEAREIIEEYSPFHSMLHKMGVRGKINDFALITDKRDHKINILNDDKNKADEKIVTQEKISYKIRYKDGLVESKVIGEV